MVVVRAGREKWGRGSGYLPPASASSQLPRLARPARTVGVCCFYSPRYPLPSRSDLDSWKTPDDPWNYLRCHSKCVIPSTTIRSCDARSDNLDGPFTDKLAGNRRFDSTIRLEGPIPGYARTFSRQPSCDGHSTIDCIVFSLVIGSRRSFFSASSADFGNCFSRRCNDR